MLPKSHRLTEEKDFKRVMQQGRSFFLKECGIKYLAQKYPKATRIGIVVPLKLTRTNVLRNRIKRQIRHIFIQHLSEINQGYDIVVLTRQEFLSLSFQEMENKIVNLLQKAMLAK